MQSHSLCGFLWVSIIGRASGISVLGGLCKIALRNSSRLWGTKYLFKETRYRSGSCESGSVVSWEPRLSFSVLNKFRWLHYQLPVSVSVCVCVCMCVCVIREPQKYILPNNVRNTILWIKVCRKEWILARPYIQNSCYAIWCLNGLFFHIFRAVFFIAASSIFSAVDGTSDTS